MNGVSQRRGFDAAGRACMLGKIFAMRFARFYLLARAVFIALFGAGGALGAPGTGAATPSAAIAPAAPTGSPEMADGYLKVGFDRLSAFPFIAPNYDPTADPKAAPPTGEEQIPAAIKKLNGSKVIVTGFLLPVKMDNGLTTELLLMKSQMLCCYGIAPQLNEWVLVEMPKGVKPVMDVPVSFRGTLHVGAMFESGCLTGIYRLDGEKMLDSSG